MSALGSERSTLNSSIHSMYWTSSQFSASTKDNSSDVSSTIDVKGKHWLPLEIEIAFVRSQAKTNQESNEQPQGSKLIISSKIRVVDPLLQEKYTWSIFDGATETLADVPASIAMGLNDLNLNWVVERFDLQAVLSQILSVEESQILLHVKVDREETREDATWMLFNDFLVQESHPSEVLSFPPWRHPCVVCFSRQNIEETPAENSLNSHGGGSENSDVIVPESVLHIQSISQVPCIRLVSKATSSPDEARLPQRGGLIAFDGEFVSVSLEQSQVSSNGQRVVQEEGRQILARMSLLYGGKAFGGTGSTIDSDIDISTLLADDYVLPLEPVLDYVTRFSGIVAEDLNPLVSKHPIITHRAAYLKLRYFIDREFIFVGHGLQKDFETANIFVPAHQVENFQLICPSI